ncbi:MAG: hypothetical protein K1W34_05625 [Lachnospiraceae bacterium]
MRTLVDGVRMPFAGVFYLWKGIFLDINRYRVNIITVVLMDIIVRLGYPFKQNAHYTVGESNRVKNLQKVNHDLYISQRDFKIEVK